MFIRLKDWEERTTADLQQEAIIGNLMMRLGQIKEAFILVIAPPAIQGLGVCWCFEMQVEDRSGAGLAELQSAVDRLVQAASQDPELVRVNSNVSRRRASFVCGRESRSSIESACAAGRCVFATLQAALGSAYVNDFNKFGRTYRVSLQADAPFRDNRDDIRRLKVRNEDGEMVSLGSLIDLKESFGPQIIRRFNLYPSATVTGNAAPDKVHGRGVVENGRPWATRVSDTIGFECSGVSKQERQAEGEEIYVFGLAVLVSYLVLAFLYESLDIALSVILVVPLGLLGTVALVWMLGMDNNTYVQIGRW